MKKPKKSIKNEKEIVINEQENNDIEQENEYENEQEYEVIDNDEYEISESIKKQLENLGIDVKGDIKFILMKKNLSGKYEHIRTYHNDLPDIDSIGDQFGGGEYYVKVFAGGKYRLGKQLSISREAYPEKKEKEIDNNKNNIEGNMVLELIKNNQELIIKMLEKQNENKSDDIEKIEKIASILKSNQPTFDYSGLFNMVGQSFQSGIQLAMNMIEQKSERGISDVLLDVFENFTKNIDPTKMLNPVNSPINNSVNTVNNSVNNPVNNQTNNITNDNNRLFLFLFNLLLKETIYNYNEGLEPYYMSNKILQIKEYEPVKSIIQKIEYDKIIMILQTSEYKDIVNNLEFLEYFKKIIDNIKNNVIIDNDINDIKEQKNDTDIREPEK